MRFLPGITNVHDSRAKIDEADKLAEQEPASVGPSARII